MKSHSLLFVRPACFAILNISPNCSVETMEPRWRNTKHCDQWRMTLNVYAAPLRDIPVDQTICDFTKRGACLIS